MHLIQRRTLKRLCVALFLGWVLVWAILRPRAFEWMEPGKIHVKGMTRAEVIWMFGGLPGCYWTEPLRRSSYVTVGDPGGGPTTHEMWHAPDRTIIVVFDGNGVALGSTFYSIRNVGSFGILRREFFGSWRDSEILRELFSSCLDELWDVCCNR